jgi:hypothetical protein
MRKINELIWHCTATPEGREVTVPEVRAWHKARGWSDIGYHRLVHLDGTVSNGRPESLTGAHVAGRNTGTLGYCYVGGVAKDGKTPKDTRTPAQKATMLRLTKEAVAKYRLAKISGHHDYAAKACPCFPARKEYAGLAMNGSVGMPSKDPADLSNSRTVKASGVGGVGVVGTTITEFTSQFESLAYYSDAFKWVFIALTVAGIAWALYARLDDAGKLPDWLGGAVPEGAPQ